VVAVLLRTDVVDVFLIGIGGIHTHKSAVMSVVVALGGAVAVVGKFLTVGGEKELETESREPVNVLTNAAAEGVFDLSVALYGYIELIVEVRHTGDTRKGSVYGYMVARKGTGIDLREGTVKVLTLPDINVAPIYSYVALVMILQYFFNFLKVSDYEIKGTIFTLFVLFQLFNAFNARELGSQSVLRRIGKNKVMLFTFLMTFLLQIILVSVFPNLFGISALTFISWLKIVGTSFSVIIVSEIYKWVYRRKVNKNYKKQIKTSWSA